MTVTIHQRFLEALKGIAEPAAATSHLHRPLMLNARVPLPQRLRVYIYTMSTTAGERQAGAFRIQIILGPRGQVGHFDWTGGAFVVLAGYAPDLDVFALWDAGIYDGPNGIAFSRNCQVRDATLYKAMTGGIAEQRRNMRGGISEDVVAAAPSHLAEALRRRWALGVERILAVKPT